MHELLSMYLEFVKILPELYPGDIAVTVTDREKHLIMIQAKTFHMGVKINDPIRENGGIYKAVHSGKTVVARIPKELYGFPVITHSVPICDPKSKEVLGVISLAVSQSKETQVVSVASELLQSAGSMESLSLDLVKAAKSLSGQSDQMSGRITSITDEIKKMDAIIGYIKSVSETSNLLGLNASIEAARAGEAGKGFAIVAEEIRKLATSSQNSSSEILNTLNSLKTNINELIAGVQSLAQISLSQEDQASKISCESSQLSNLSQSLKQMAEELV